MKPMQFGMMKLTRIPYQDLERDIREAEAMGFDSAWIDDDLFSPSYAELDVWSVLGGLAVATERIRLGTLVSVPTFRLPAVMATQALTVDHMSNGRVEVALALVERSRVILRSGRNPGRHASARIVWESTWPSSRTCCGVSRSTIPVSGTRSRSTRSSHRCSAHGHH